MEISAREWKKKATENITQYVHRGGEGQGDKPELIGGPALINTIGVAMGLPTCDPDDWTERELHMALNGELVYFVGKAREAIDVVADQLRSCCGGDHKNYVTVLPIELYLEGKLYELPLFRVRRTLRSRAYYVDNVGRCYDSVSDWDEHNVLPPAQVAYPAGLQLGLAHGSQRARVIFEKTARGRLGPQVARGADVASGVAGLGASVALLFVSGGLAAPLVVTSLGAAAWGAGRSAYRLADRATHGESINPFDSAESRMLCLGFAATLTSFGAMGATMRVSSLAARGRDVSTALRVVTNVANGTNVTVSGLAVLNSTLYLVEHRENLSAIDVLMHVASVAFWTKGVFAYKTTSMIIKDAETAAFATMTKGLSKEQADQFNAVRNRIQNDVKILQKYQAMKANVSPKEFSQLLVDGVQYYDAVTGLSPEQMDAFDGLRLYMRGDVNLISGLRRVSERYRLNPTETLETVLNMWQQMSAAPPSDDGGIVALRGGSLVLGRAPPIRIDQLSQLSAPMIRFLGEHLSRVDAATERRWAASVPVLLELQGRGLFTECPVTGVVRGGRAVLALNGHLEVSIYRLQAMTPQELATMLGMLRRVAPDAGSAALPPALLRLCVREQRLRLQCQRRESVARAAELVRGRAALLRLVRAELQSHEQDRLYTFLGDMELCKADQYSTKMMAFVEDLEPKTISELVAYCEFVMTYIENEALALKGRVKSGELSKPDGIKISIWARSAASEAAFGDAAAVRRALADALRLVRAHDMVGAARVGGGLSAAQLQRALRGVRVRYGGAASAAYHVLKHPTRPLEAHVERANATLRAADARFAVRLAQDGDARTVAVEDAHGKCFLLERDGSVILCSFSPK